MKRRKLHNYILINLLLCLFLSIGIHKLLEAGGFLRLNENTVTKEGFRRQELNDEILDCARDTKDPGKNLGLYLLETNFSGKSLENLKDPGLFPYLEKKWARREYFDDYTAQCRGIWNDLVYFPIPEPSNNVSAGVSYVDSWMFDRNYGGKRGHEGTDIMADKNVRGFYPVVSMTDGVVRHKGWLEQGGWRLGIVAPGEAYFYYAHMDSYADIEVGDSIKAGDLLGYMGDTGYSTVEGTTGNFPVHLHIGIYLFHKEQEISINPYWALRYIESQKIKCAYSR